MSVHEETSGDSTRSTHYSRGPSQATRGTGKSTVVLSADRHYLVTHLYPYGCRRASTGKSETVDI
jgi:hypothetical protein